MVAIEVALDGQTRSKTVLLLNVSHVPGGCVGPASVGCHVDSAIQVSFGVCANVADSDDAAFPCDAQIPDRNIIAAIGRGAGESAERDVAGACQVVKKRLVADANIVSTQRVFVEGLVAQPHVVNPVVSAQRAGANSGVIASCRIRCQRSCAHGGVVCASGKEQASTRADFGVRLSACVLESGSSEEQNSASGFQ